jgi:hypothetical protein
MHPGQAEIWLFTADNMSGHIIDFKEMALAAKRALS